MNLDPDVFKKAAHLTGVHEKTSLIHLGLQALITRENNKRLAALGGAEPGLATPATG